MQILEHVNSSKSTDPNHQQVHSMFISDNLTDLLCLLRMDVEIVLDSSSILKQVYGEKMTSLSKKALVVEHGHMHHGQELFYRL